MDITWLGHACFRIRGRDVTVVTDPYDRELGYPTLKLTADVVTVSSDDPHHSNVATVQPNNGRMRTLDGPGEYEVAGALVEAVQTHRDKQKGKERGKNTAFLIHVEDVSICHLGAIGHTLSSAQIDALKDADVLLTPIGGHGTLDAAEAAEVVSQLEPKVVIPMQYGTPGLESDSVDRFCKEMAATDTTAVPRFSVTKSALPDEARVVLLQPPEPRR